MGDSYQVTVIVLVYNAALDKIKKTLISCLWQKDTTFEVIVSDDGSKMNYAQDIELFFEKYSFRDYKILTHKENVGTVTNLNEALSFAKGTYIKVISPGDYLYSNFCLSRFISYANKHNSKLVFGNAIYYSEEGELKIYDCLTSPRNKKVYQKQPLSCQDEFRRLCLYGDNISGAITIIETYTAKMLMDKIEGRIRYIEDVSFAILPLTGTPIEYLDENIIWYEYGQGISTNRDKEAPMRKELRREQLAFWEMIKQSYPVPSYLNRVIKYYKIRVKEKNIIDKIIKTVIAPERNIHISRKKINHYDLNFLYEIYNKENDK